MTALILCILFGGLGVHYMYVGKYFKAFVYLLTGGLVGVGWFIDIFRIAFGSFKDKWGNPLIEW